MQKLTERYTYTPTDIPHVRSNCDVWLNRPEGRDSATHLKTPANNPDAALTAREQAGQNLRVSAVYVLNQRGEPLMPTTPRKAQMLQSITLGVDSGFIHIGLSAVSKRKELYNEEVNLRDDMVKLNSERREYRRGRRSRKTWYRKPRFLNRGNKKKGWLAPSIQNKLDAQLKSIEKIRKILPISHITVEVASFDIQKIKNPEIEGVEYQQGEQSGFWNVREYVLHRDGHTCQHCKSKEVVLNVHHILSRQTGGDRPDNLITLCKTCHQKHHQAYCSKQVRKCNRKLFKGKRSHIPNTAPRFILGFQRFDKVIWKGQECFIFGRRQTGYFDLRLLDGTRVHASALAKEIRLLESAKTFLTESRRRIPPPPQGDGVSCAEIL